MQTWFFCTSKMVLHFCVFFFLEKILLFFFEFPPEPQEATLNHGFGLGIGVLYDEADWVSARCRSFGRWRFSPGATNEKQRDFQVWIRFGFIRPGCWFFFNLWFLKRRQNHGIHQLKWRIWWDLTHSLLVGTLVFEGDAACKLKIDSSPNLSIFRPQTNKLTWPMIAEVIQ